MKPLTIAARSLAGLLAAATLAGAQTRSAVTGTVTDSSQALLPGVTVTLASPDLVGGAQTATTGRDGTSRFWDLPPGVYSGSAQFSVFRPVNRTEMRLLFGTTFAVDFVLWGGNLTGRRVVGGRAPAVDVTTARSTSKIDAE